VGMLHRGGFAALMPILTSVSAVIAARAVPDTPASAAAARGKESGALFLPRGGPGRLGLWNWRRIQLFYTVAKCSASIFYRHIFTGLRPTRR